MGDGPAGVPTRGRIAAENVCGVVLTRRKISLKNCSADVPQKRMISEENVYGDVPARRKTFLENFSEDVPTKRKMCLGKVSGDVPTRRKTSMESVAEQGPRKAKTLGGKMSGDVPDCWQGCSLSPGKRTEGDTQTHGQSTASRVTENEMNRGARLSLTQVDWVHCNINDVDRRRSNLSPPHSPMP